jgi:hypothetical protein
MTNRDRPFVNGPFDKGKRRKLECYELCALLAGRSLLTGRAIDYMKVSFLVLVSEGRTRLGWQIYQ